MMVVEPGKTRVGWIGTGVMGRWMCEHVLNKGYQVTVYNRTKGKAQPLLYKGAKWADSPKEVAEQSDVVFTIVGFPPMCGKSISARRGFWRAREQA